MKEGKLKLPVIILVVLLIVETILLVGLWKNGKPHHITGVYFDSGNHYNMTIYNDGTAKIYYRNGEMVFEGTLIEVDDGAYYDLGDAKLFWSDDKFYVSMLGGVYRFDRHDDEAYILTVEDEAQEL